jgi:hypothetical protein
MTGNFDVTWVAELCDWKGGGGGGGAGVVVGGGWGLPFCLYFFTKID